MHAAVIIPAYNEAQNISSVVRGARQYVPKVIVVDDGSTDATSAAARDAGAEVLRHRVNLGKGAALKTGCEYALGKGVQNLVVMDADGQHNPRGIPRFMEALQEHDLALGERVVPKTMPAVLRFGNKVINTSLSILYGLSIRDSQCGYRAFTASAYEKLRWEALDYYVETEMLLRAGKKKLRCTRIPIDTIYKDRYKGTTVIDGMLIMAKMMGWRIFK